MVEKYKPDFYKVTSEGPFDKRSQFDYKIDVDFNYVYNEDLVVRGGAFAYYWDGEQWSKDLKNVVLNIDSNVRAAVNKLKAEHPDSTIKYGLAENSNSGIVTKFQKYCQALQTKDITFNTKIFFDDQTPKRDDYSTIRLNYHPQHGKCDSFDKLAGTLYNPEELDKILWAIGALFTGNMPKIQKFLFLYGAAGTGKGTMLDIISKMFQDYRADIDLEKLTNGSQFGTSQIVDVPLLVDSDSKIDRIKKDTDLLKLVSHEPVMVRKLYQDGYSVSFQGLLVTASNAAYDAKNVNSGIHRRALVVHPSGNIVSKEDYNRLMNDINYEIPYIAQKAIDRYNELGEAYYDNYRDEDMVMYSDKFHACVSENLALFTDNDGITLNQATSIYKTYIEELGWEEKGIKAKVKNRLHDYYREYTQYKMIDGVRLTRYYSGFKYEKFPFLNGKSKPENIVECEKSMWLDLSEQPSLFDKEAADYPAQLSNENGTPKYKWDTVRTTLKDIDTNELHYVKVPQNHIVLDFDMKNEKGDKDLDLNIKEALNYPQTYAEVSKSGGGLHLHYWYDGDVTKLKNVIKDDVEVKVYTGNSSLRRKLIKCNNLHIAHIATGLPLKEKEVVMYKDIEDIHWTEKKLRTFIENCMDKIHHSATKPEIDFIYTVLEQAKDTGVKYNLNDMLDPLTKFAMHSTNNSAYCLGIVNKLTLSTYQTEDEIGNGNDVVNDKDIVFFDIEVFPNLFLVCWKKNGFEIPAWVYDDLEKDINSGNNYHPSDTIKSNWYDQHKNKDYGIWANPSTNQLEFLLQFPLVGFNNRKYDNHILYNASLGASPMDLYMQSQNIINHTGDGGMKPAAYNLSYADLYEFMDIKQSLKKWEIALGLTHDEFEFPWDQPLAASNWARCAMYCMHDVEATDKVFNDPNAGQPAWMARKVMCELTEMSPNTKTQTLAEKFLFGDEQRPQDNFIWYDLAKEFPGYTFDPNRKPASDYHGKDPSEGGYVSSKPGVYGVTVKDYNAGNIIDPITGRCKLVTYIDVASLHPHSLIAINYFGKYTPKFKALVKCRMHIKHGELDKAASAFDDIDPALSEKLSKFLSDPSLIKGLAHAMKIIINIVYGMTSAKYDNKFRDPRNVDNIIAKRGALFMMMLEEELNARGCNVIHVKTDSMKITNYLQEDIQYAMDRATDFGYTFELECIFDRLALTNKSTNIGHIEGKPEYDAHAWEAVGAQYAESYVFKKLFSHEELVEEDFMVLKSSTAPIYLGNRFIGKNAYVYASITGEKLYAIREENIAQSIHTKAQKPIKDYLAKRDYEGLPLEVQEANRAAKISKELKARDFDISPERVQNIIDNKFPETKVTKRSALAGTKDWEWKLSTEYKGKDDVNMGYYGKLVDDAVADIYKVGNGNIIFEGTKYARA